MFGLSGQTQPQSKQMNPRERMAMLLSGQAPQQAQSAQGDAPNPQFGGEDWQQAAILRNRGAQQYQNLGYAMPQGQQPNARQLSSFAAQQRAAQSGGGYASPETGTTPGSTVGGIGAGTPRATPSMPSQQQMYAVQQWLRSPAGQQWAQTDYGKSEIQRRSWQSLL